MAPLRVAIVGLSSHSTGAYEPGAWASRAHVPSINKSAGFEVAAIVNSSQESARKAIELNKLPSTTGAYGSVKEAVADPNVDLVVVCVRIGKHVELSEPVLLANKHLFLEWPIAPTLAEAEALTKLALKTGKKHIVGLQARADPLVLKTKEFVQTGKIGRILSSSVIASSAYLPTTMFPEGAEYYLDMKSGGNEFTIFFGHFLDAFTNVLGDFANLQSILKTDYHMVPIVNNKGEPTGPLFRKTSPEDILVQGTLETGALATIAFRKPPVAVDNVGLRWLITGTEGEIEITTGHASFQMDHPDRKLRVRTSGSEKAEDVDFRAGVTSVLGDVSGPSAHATNTALSYEAFANGDESRYATFESALKTHRLLDEIVRKANFNP